MPSRLPRARSKRPRTFPGLTLIAIGPKQRLPVPHWSASCTSDGEEAIGASDYVVLFEEEGHIPRCFLLANLVDQLYDMYVAQEPLVYMHGYAITSAQFKAILAAARRYLPDFRERYKRTEISHVANILANQRMLRHQETLMRSKRLLREGKIDKQEMKQMQIQSSNDFDTYYTEVKGRAKRVFESLGPYETLTVRKVARNDAEYEAAMNTQRS